MNESILQHASVTVPGRLSNSVPVELGEQVKFPPRELLHACASSSSIFIDPRILMDLREDETISVEPFWILWIECHEFVEQNVGNRCHAHRGARVARVRLVGGIDL